MAIETIKERMVVVWNDDGTFRGASLDERFAYEDKSTRNAQRPLTETEADDLIGSGTSDLLKQVETLTADRDALKAANDTLEKAAEESVATIVGLSSAIDDLKDQLAEMTTSRNTYKDLYDVTIRKIYDPRLLTVAAFQRRFTNDEIRAIALKSASDANVAGVLKTLDDYAATGELMSLDKDLTRQGVGYLAMVGLIEPRRVAEILRDSTQEDQR